MTKTMNHRRLTLDVSRLMLQGLLWDQMMEITDIIAADLTAGKVLIDSKECGMSGELIANFYSKSGKALKYHADEDPILVIFKDPENGSLFMNYLFPNA